MCSDLHVASWFSVRYKVSQKIGAVLTWIPKNIKKNKYRKYFLHQDLVLDIGNWCSPNVSADCRVHHSSDEAAAALHRPRHLHQAAGGGEGEEGQLRSRSLRSRAGEKNIRFPQCCGSGIRDEQPGSYFIELRNHFLGLKYSNSMMRIRDGKIRIRNKHPGSATDFPREFALTGSFVVEYVSGFCCFGIGQDQRWSLNIFQFLICSNIFVWNKYFPFFISKGI